MSDNTPVRSYPVALTVLAWLVSALIVRLLYLGRASLWCDEILFVYRSAPPATPWSLLQLTWEQLPVVTHFPFPRIAHNLLQWIFYSGDATRIHDPFFARLPAVLWGTFALWPFRNLARRVLDTRAAWLATLWMCVGLFPVYYSREAYYYAPLLFFSALLLNAYMGVLQERRMGWGRGLALALGAIGAVYSHLSGTVLVVILLLHLIVFLPGALGTKLGLNGAASLRRTAGFLLVALALVSPFYIRLAANTSPLTYPPSPGLFRIGFDMFGKLFLGNLIVFNVLALVVFAAGCVSAFRPAERRVLRVMTASIWLSGVVVLLLFNWRTQYSPRYFTVLLPGFILIGVLGLQQLAAWVARLPGVLRNRRQPVFAVVSGLFILLQLAVLPFMYALPAKGVDYKGLADWLTGHLPVGTPYLMESAYELRFTSSVFPTPGLVAASPYVHGSGPGELDTLRQRQRQFLERFPEAAWVESARHNLSPETGLSDWGWPHQHFRQRVDLVNAPMQWMSRLGVWLPVLYGALSVTDQFTPIWYNTAQDRDAMALAEGKPVLFDFPGWACTAFQGPVYLRFHPGPQAVVVARNLLLKPLRGHVRVQGVLLGPTTTQDVRFTFNGQPAGQAQVWGGQMVTFDSDALEIRPGSQQLAWTATQVEGVQGFAVDRVFFVPE